MAKRTSRRKRRQRKPNVPKYTGPIESAAATQAPTRPQAAARPKPKSAEAKATANVDPAANFAEEYRYVVGDLRNMMIVAGAMVILLLATNLVINLWF